MPVRPFGSATALRFAPVAAASTPQARCTSTPSSADRAHRLHSSSGLLHPSGSKRSTAFAACRSAWRIRPISLRSPQPFPFTSMGYGSTFWVRYVSAGLLRVRRRRQRAVVLWLCHRGSRNRSSRVYRCLSPQDALGISIDFSSCWYSDVSFPSVRDPCGSSGRLAAIPIGSNPFGHPRINGCLLLPGAFRSLPRPSSPPKPSHPPYGVGALRMSITSRRMLAPPPGIPHPARCAIGARPAELVALADF
jgi:hypothetical protein